MSTLIIGSTEHSSDFIEMAQMFGTDGAVYFWYDDEPESRMEIFMGISDQVVVIDHYISTSMQKAIKLANELNMPVKYYTDLIKSEKLRVVTLCGSMKFQHRMRQIAKKMSLEGNVVLTPCIMGFDPKSLTPKQHEVLDQIHRQKIDMCDYVLIINVGGYYGSNTKEEIDYAKSIGKEVRYLEPVRGAK